MRGVPIAWTRTRQMLWLVVLPVVLWVIPTPTLVLPLLASWNCSLAGHMLSFQMGAKELCGM